RCCAGTPEPPRRLRILSTNPGVSAWFLPVPQAFSGGRLDPTGAWSAPMETLTSCPVCGGGEFIQFAVERDEHDEFSRLILPGQKLGSCLCKACSFLFQNPRLPRNPVEAYYGQSMYRKRDGAITIEEGYKSYAVMQLTRY